jgi:hypothetical protein
VLPCIAALVSIGAVYGALAVPSAIYGGAEGWVQTSGTLPRLPMPQAAPAVASLGPVQPTLPVERTGRLCTIDCPPALEAAEQTSGGKTARLAAAPAPDFDAVVRAAALSPSSIAEAVREARVQPAESRIEVAEAGLPDGVLRRMKHAAKGQDSAPIVLAYATTERSRAVRALDVLSTLPDVQAGLIPDDALDQANATLVPDFEDTPEDTPLPAGRPRFEQREKPASRAASEQVDEEAKPKPRKRMAYAKPDKPEPKGGLFDRWRGGKRAGKGVAVYDISAARVYMPDGSVLEAHSGIGKMADNPKYAHVKMKGPTPPHTYNLRMREKRFHGVEAIRMLPVDGKNKHGRDGFLTHSYLLRGGRAESHGCVAFKNYDKFLKAFKQGKITQLVVVPSGGKAAAVQVAAR